LLCNKKNRDITREKKLVGNNGENVEEIEKSSSVDTEAVINLEKKRAAGFIYLPLLYLSSDVCNTASW